MSDEVQLVEVITSVQRRRRWSVAEKIRLVEETLQPSMSVSFVARKHGFSPSLLFKEAADGRGGREAVRVDDEVIGASRVRQFEERIRELERLLGRKTLEVEILKEALAAAGKKTAVALAVARSGRFPMKAVADTLGVARSNLAVQGQRGGSRPRPLYRVQSQETSDAIDVTHGVPPDQPPTLPGPPEDVGEAQEGEGFGLALTSSPAVRLRWPIRF
jgi:transposase-like protein